MNVVFFYLFLNLLVLKLLPILTILDLKICNILYFKFSFEITLGNM
jgi:hypothetical protein